MLLSDHLRNEPALRPANNAWQVESSLSLCPIYHCKCVLSMRIIVDKPDDHEGKATKNGAGFVFQFTLTQLFGVSHFDWSLEVPPNPRKSTARTWKPWPTSVSMNAKGRSEERRVGKGCVSTS